MTGTLNKRGRDDLKNLYKNNQNFRDGVINFVGDKTGLSNDQIIDKTFKHKTLKKLGVENLNKFVQSKENTRILIELLASYSSELKR